MIGRMLVARTAAEAHLYVDLECEALGEVPIERKQRPASKRNVRQVIEFTMYEVRCQSGKLLEFEFSVLPKERPGLRRSVSYGGKEPSQLLDAGDWMLIADRHVGKAPKSVAGMSEKARKLAKEDLQIAIACVDEILKFIRPGETSVSSTTLTGNRGKTYFNKDVRRFRRDQLDGFKSELSSRIARIDKGRF
jgi:hypothetical protein